MIQVLLIHEHPMMADALTLLLSVDNDIAVVRRASTWHEAIELAATVKAQVLVLDACMSGLNGIELALAIGRRERSADVRILLVSDRHDRLVLWRAIQAGVRGHVSKNQAGSILRDAVRAVANGSVYFNPAFDEQSLVPDVSRLLLTAREREVLQLVAAGLSTKEIASRLGLSTRTVEHHREHIVQKTGAENIAGLTRYAVRHHMILP